MSARHYLSYTYFLKWSILNKKYYGSRVANEVEPRKDLWVNYFGSSNYVDRLVDLFGKPDVIRVDKTFTDEQEAQKYEIQVLKENDVVNDSTWLNQHIPGEGFTTAGREHTKKWREEASKRMKGQNNPMYRKDFSKGHRQKISISISGEKHPMYGIKGKNHYNFGRKRTEESRKKQSESNKGQNNPMYGKFHTKETRNKMKQPRTDETKLKISNSKKGVPQPSKMKKINIDNLTYNSIKEASEKLNKDRSTIYNWIKKGKAKIIS